MPLDLNERQTYARRIIAQRCLYGVDKNPLAVEMAKLSLWLLTLAKDKPFEFLDHAIRCGDSLVGIHNLDQLRTFNLDGKGENNSLFLQFLEPRIKEAIGLRNKLEGMQANTVEDVQAQEQLLLEANEKIERLKCAADMLVGAEFLRWQQHELIEEELRDEEEASDEERPEPSWLKAKKATEQFRRAARTHAAIETAVHFNDSDLDTFHYQCQMWLNGETPFHWPLEFPEVFQMRGGFDAFVCNPPFMGGQKITGNLGDEFREYMVHWLAYSQRGSADLCAYFFLRASQLLRDGGQLGFLATNTIAQGDTREVGLEQLMGNGFMIPRAVPSRPWPGSANLEVAHVWVRRGAWNGACVLDEQPTNGITAFLTPPGIVSGNPYRLKANEGKSFQGSIVLGLGFVLEPEETQRLIEKDARNKDVLFPYLNGEDLNSQPDQSPSRWAINFFDWPIEKAMWYLDCFRIVEEKVKPERMRNNRKVYRERWWQYAEKRPELSRTIAGAKRVLVTAEVSKHINFAFRPPSEVFSHMLIVFPLSTFNDFALVQSTLHETWCRDKGSTLETRFRYTPSDCFETFPFPSTLTGLDAVGERYHEHRRQIMLARQEGLTKTYNRFHNSEEASADIQKLRDLHVEMDHAVAAAYGWTDLDLGHGFHQTKQGLRYTISEPARREVLARLLKLNHERYDEEVRQGLHEKKAKKKGRNKVKANTEDGDSLFS